jgi:hypothetical protein
LWTGELVDDLLLWDEQGYGDAIQSLRWLPAAAERCRRLRLWLRPELVRLVRQRLPLPPHCQLELLRQELAPWQQSVPHLPLMSLPMVLGLEGPQMALGAGLKRSRQASDQRTPGPPCLGLVWAAGRKAEAEADRHARGRSLRLAELMVVLAPLVTAGCLALQPLQVGPDAAEAGAFGGLLAPPPSLQDWEDTAALVETLDGVISVDTAVAHLAGSLGLPTLLLLECPCDWRWGQEGDTTPWYPSVRLLRRRPGQLWERLLAKELARSGFWGRREWA